MKIRKIVFAGLFLTAGLTIAPAQVKLSFNPEKGKKYEYQMDVTQNIRQSVMGQTIPMETEMSIKFLMEIKDKTPQEITAQFIYREVSYILSSPMMKMEYDSENPLVNPTQMDNTMRKMFDKLIEQPIMAVIAPDGTVKSVTGMDAIAENMVNAIADDGQMAALIGAQMKSQFSDDAIKNLFQQSLKIYPANAVKAGDIWNEESATSVNNMNTTYKTKYTLKEVSKNMVTIAVETDVEMDPGAMMEGKLAGTQTGTILVDVKTGLPVTNEMTGNIKGSVKAQGMDVQMDLSTKTKTTTKEVK